MRRWIFAGVAIYVVALALSRVPPTPAVAPADENAKLDQEIATALARDGVYVPPQIKNRNEGDAAALWTSNRFTMACGAMKDAEAFAFLTAMQSDADLVNPYSDASQTSCRRVAPGMAVRRGRKVGDAGLVEVWINGTGPLFMPDAFVVPR